MVNYHRHTGSISTRPGTQGVPQVSEVYTHGENLPVSKTSFWTEVISRNFHRHHSPPGGTLRNQGHQSDILLRRYPGAGEDTEVIVPAQRLRIDPTSPSGVQTQQQEVSANAFTGLFLPGIGMEYNNNDCFSLTGQTRSNTTTDRSFIENAYGLHERLYGIARQDEFRVHGDSFGQPALSATTILPTSTCNHSGCLKQKNFSVSRSSRLIALVDVANKEWSNIKNESSHLCDHHRRILDGVRCSYGSTVHTRQVDGHGQIESYQLPGIEDCFVCSTAMEKSVKEPDGLATTGQYNGCCLPSKGGGTQSRSLHYLAAEILTLADLQNISVRPSYLPGQINTQADALSRSKEPDEWMLNQYFSTDRCDPHSLGTDALHHDWDFQSKLLYAFLPPNLIPLVVGRVHHIKSQMILITPWWPRAPWLPELIELSVRLPHRLPECRDTILNLTTNTGLKDYHKLNMMVWLISARPSETEGSNLKWPDLFRMPGNPLQKSSTPPSGDSGRHGVAEKALMQLPLLW